MKTQSCEVCWNEEVTLDKHHIVSKSCSGTNEKHNIAHLCPNCHRLVHTGDIVLEGIFLTSEGYMLIWHNRNEASITGASPEVYNFGK